MLNRVEITAEYDKVTDSFAGPVRQVSSTSRGIKGVVPGMGRYESTLERDMMELIRFDRRVRQFTPQPLTISYRDESGVSRTYTPDGLIQFELLNPHEPTILYEVKFRADFRKAWRTYMPKFRAAQAYCRQRGWVFRVYTEVEIRSAYLSNVRFLWPYVARKVDLAMKHHVLNVLWDLGEADPDFLLHALCSDPTGRARLIPVLWHMLASGEIGCDLDSKLTMSTRIWPMKEACE